MHFHTRASAALAALAVAGGAGVAVALGPAGQAVGQTSQPIQLAIQVDSPATLVAKGAGVDVLVTVECSGTTTPAGVSVSLTERAGSFIAVGSGQTAVGCTNTSQTVLVRVTAQAGGFGTLTAGKAFKRGTAIANANINACTPDFSFCANQQAEPTISIK
jgi:hypothetical protein